MGRRKFDSKARGKKKASREEDATWRLTHLLTASHLMAAQVPSLSRFYMRTSSEIGRRINLTMDCMTVKRQVCKKCHTLLLPNGPTPYRVRVVAKRERHIVVTCGNCGYFRRYLARVFDPAADNVRLAKKEELKRLKQEKRQQRRNKDKQKNKDNNKCIDNDKHEDKDRKVDQKLKVNNNNNNNKDASRSQSLSLMEQSRQYCCIQ